MHAFEVYRTPDARANLDRGPVTGTRNGSSDDNGLRRTVMATPLTEMPETAVQLDDPTTYLAGPPHDFFDYLRREEPVHWHASPNYAPGFWVVTKYADVIGIERDVKTFSSAQGGALLDDQQRAPSS